MPRPINFKITPANQGTTTISLAQTVSGASVFLLNGALAGGPYDVNSVTYQHGGSVKVGRQLSFTSTGNISAVTMTITGTDANGDAQSETMAGPNNNTVYSVKYYNTITSVATSGSVGTNTSIGTYGFASQTLPLNYYRRIEHTLDIECTGTITFTIQETFNDVYSDESIIWQNVPSMTNKVITSSVPAAVNQQGTLNAIATRFVANTYTNGATAKVIIIQSAGTSDD